MIVAVKDGYISNFVVSDLNEHQKGKLQAQGYELVEYNLNYKQPRYVSGVWIEEYVIDKEGLIKSANDTADSLINEQYEQKALNFMLDIKADLKSKETLTEGETLILEIIESVKRWQLRFWALYDVYRKQIEDAETDDDLPVINYSAVGERPIRFNDLKWLLDPELQALYPDRVVNTDITFYQNF